MKGVSACRLKRSRTGRTMAEGNERGTFLKSLITSRNADSLTRRAASRIFQRVPWKNLNRWSDPARLVS